MKKFTTRFLSISFLVVLCFSFNSYSQKIVETQTVVGRLVRITPKLADIDRTSMYGKPLVITRDEDGVIGIGRNLEEAEEKVEKELLEKFRDPVTGNLKPLKQSEAIQKPGTIFPHIPGSSLGVNFNGQTSPGLQPTDNNMAAGPNHVIQIVNNTAGSQFTIWNKTGTVVQPATILATVTGFSGFGDPIVLYDQLADRWLMAEFGAGSAGGGVPHRLQIAVSTSGDPTGTWKIYQFEDLNFFMDYPKFSVWHNAYYACTNDFNNAGTSYLGSSVYSMDRAAMLAGSATATMMRTRLNDAGNNYNMGTIGLEGMTTSTQNGLFAYPVGPSTINVFEVTPNFGAGTQTIGPNTSLAIAAFSAPPATVPMQGGGSIQTLGQRLMFKLNYRNNSGTESIVMTHSVGNSGLAAVRWYELRRVAGNWTVYQQGTVTGSDGNSRFMGGISMDAQGNIALMYDVSGSSSFPSIKYTGRNSCDPLNQMTLPEQTIINASSNCGCSRWGDYNTTVQDYTAVGVPTNGSFWSTSQYGNQLTRIANYTLTNPCAGPVIQSSGSSLVSETCSPSNGVIDAAEQVTVSFCLQNVGNINTTNLVATLLSTGGVVSPSGPQTYGVLTAGGPSVCQNFTFNNTALCGQTITATLQLQDGATPLGTTSFTFTVGTLNVVTFFSENFDGVTAPTLPAGWVTSQPVNVTGANPWQTSNSGTPTPVAVSAPNSIFAPDPANLTDNIIETPAIAVPSGAGSKVVTFKNNFNLESSFDGGVLEISINGGAYSDIITAGGSFNSGGYTGTISTSFQSPIAGRQAWTGNSGGFITTSVNLPAAAAGQNIKLRFREASDNSVSPANSGWRVDDVILVNSGYVCCGVPPPCVLTCPANVTVNTDPGQCGAFVNYSPVTASGSCGTITSVPSSGSFFPKGTTTVTATSQSGATCSFTVTVVDAQAPTTTCPGNQTKSTDAGVCTYTTQGTQFDATATDNCPGVTKAYSLAGVTTGTGTTLAGVVFNKGVTTVTWTSTDAVGLTSSCSFTVTVNDTELPKLNCPGNSTKTTAVNVCTYIASGTEFNPTLLSDNCPGVTSAYTLTGTTTGTGSSTLAGVAFNTGVTTVKWTATDASGNTTTCSFTVTVNDGSLPITTQPTNKTVCEGSNATFSVTGTAGATLTYQWQQWNGTAWVNIAGATASTYTISNATIAMNTNSFRVILTTICGNSITSSFASLYINKLPVITLTTSRSPALIPGQFLTITANGIPTGGTIVWTKNGTVYTIPGSNPPVNYDAFKISNLTVDDIGTYSATYTDLNGCSSTSGSVTVTAQAYDKLFVYPNPNDGSFQIRFYNSAGQQVRIVITDAKGAKVYEKSVVTGQLAYSRIDVDLRQYSSGVYMVEMFDSGGNKMSSKRFIIGH